MLHMVPWDGKMTPKCHWNPYMWRCIRAVVRFLNCAVYFPDDNSEKYPGILYPGDMTVYRYWKLNFASHLATLCLEIPDFIRPLIGHASNCRMHGMSWSDVFPTVYHVTYQRHDEVWSFQMQPPGGTQLSFWYRCAARRAAIEWGLKERVGTKNSGLKNWFFGKNRA